MSGLIKVRSRRFKEESIQTNTWNADEYQCSWSDPHVVRIHKKSDGQCIGMINGRDVLTVEFS